MADIWLNNSTKTNGFRIGIATVVILSLAAVGVSFLLVRKFWNQHENQAVNPGASTGQSPIRDPAPGEPSIAVDECNRAFAQLRAEPWQVVGGSAETTGRLYEYPKTAAIFLRHMRKDSDPYIALWSSYWCVERKVDSENAYQQLKEGIHSTNPIWREFTASALGNLASLDAAVTLKAAIKEETDNRALHSEIDALNRFCNAEPPTEGSRFAKATLEELKRSTDPRIKEVFETLEIARKLNEGHQP